MITTANQKNTTTVQVRLGWHLESLFYHTHMINRWSNVDVIQREIDGFEGQKFEKIVKNRENTL